MNAILSADWHLGQFRNGSTINGVNGRLLDIKERIDEILNFAESKKAGMMVLAGDMFRERHPDMAHMEILSQSFKRLIDDKIETLVIPGNHDVSRIRGSSHTLTPFMPLTKDTCIHIVDKPTIINDIALFPYMSAPQEPALKEFLKIVPPSCRFLVMHGTVRGAVLNKLVDYEIHDEDAVDANLLDRFQWVFAGHIHDAQKFRNVVYPGSIERLDFGDEFSNKSFVRLPDDGGIETCHLNARKMVTVSYQILKDHYKELDLKDAIVRVINADKDFIPDIRRMLVERRCYYIAGISTVDAVRQEITTKEMLDTPKFVERFAKKVEYVKPLEPATEMIMEMLDAQT